MTTTPLEPSSAPQRVSELYRTAEAPIVSFELFPPKDEQSQDRFDNSVPELVALQPDYMTVTYGALGSTRDRTLDTVRRVRKEFGMECACHLTCVAASRPEMNDTLQEIYDAGIRNIVALRGDPPESGPFVAPPNGFAFANELVDHIRRFESTRNLEPFSIAVAGYPEKHIEAADKKSDMLFLKKKVDAGADLIVTQLFFNNDDFFRFVDDAHAVGIDVPIVPGLMPILSIRQVLRMTDICGASIPTDLMQLLEEAREDGARGREIGVTHCVNQARGLLQQGVPGIHFFVLNRSQPMKQIMDQLDLH